MFLSLSRLWALGALAVLVALSDTAAACPAPELGRSGAAIVTVTTATGLPAHGGGVVWDGAGHVVTNHHVLTAGRDPVVTLADGRGRPARVVAVVPSEDLALLEIDAAAPSIPGWTSVPTGDEVVAIGNPRGQGFTVTRGRVQALGLLVDSGGRLMRDMVGTNVPLLPGNSGGPLFDCAGRLVGINAAAVLVDGRSTMGLAIPAARVAAAVALMLPNARLAQNPLAQTPHRRTFGLLVTPTKGGLAVVGVTPEAPAARAGIVNGDILQVANGHALTTPQDLTREIADGDRARLIIERDGLRLTLAVDLAG